MGPISDKEVTLVAYSMDISSIIEQDNGHSPSSYRMT